MLRALIGLLVVLVLVAFLLFLGAPPVAAALIVLGFMALGLVATGRV